MNAAGGEATPKHVIQHTSIRYNRVLSSTTPQTPKMNDLLREVKTVKQDPGQSLTARSESSRDAISTPTIEPRLGEDLSPNQIIDALKSQPSQEQVSVLLTSLDPYNNSRKLNLDIRIPGPVSAQILHVLVSTTIPDHWAPLVKDGKTAKSAKIKAALLRCLSSLAGVGSLVTRLRSLIASIRAAPQLAEGSSGHPAIHDVLSVLAALLEPKDFVYRLYGDISTLHESSIRRRLAWNEAVSLVGSGRIVSTAAEALEVANEIQSSSVAWLGDGRRYASWLGINISYALSKFDVDDETTWPAIASLTERALSLGYSCKRLSQ